MRMRSFSQKKLWRDKAVAMMEQNHGSRIEWRRLNDQEYDEQLRLKLLEEAQEVGASKSRKELIEECSDILEVLDALWMAHGITQEDVIRAQIKKRNEKGGFSERMFVDVAHHPVGGFGEAYCLASPEKYPEIIENM